MDTLCEAWIVLKVLPCGREYMNVIRTHAYTLACPMDACVDSGLTRSDVSRRGGNTVAELHD